MNILLITRLYPEFAGQPRLEATYAIHDFAKEWAKNHNVYVMRIFDHYPLIKNLSKFGFGKKAAMYSYDESFLLDGVTVFRILVNRISRIKYSKSFVKAASMKIIKEINSHLIPDAIICHISLPNLLIGTILKAKYGCRLIWCLHETDIRILKNVKNAKEINEIEHYVDKIAQRSHKIQKEFIRLYQGEKRWDEFFIAMSGISKETIIPQEALNKKIIQSAVRILTVASLRKRKNVDTVIKAFALNEREGHELFIVGDGEEKQNLEKLVLHLGCQENVHMVGLKQKDEVLDMMEKSHIFVMVSSSETLGLVYLEAMAKGCIVIGSRGEGIDGVIVDDENGFLCEPGNVEELVSVLERVKMLDIAEKRRIITNAVNTIREMDQEKMAKKYLDWIIE